MSEVADWLNRIGLGQYIEAFDDNGVNFALLSKITNDDLKDIGVGRLADRKRLIEEIERLSSPQSDWSGNRRLLTVLFCDLVGSTELSTRLDPEELRAALRRYQETALASISKYGGAIANNLGDGVMAYFGWPQADEDQARQAVRAGFDMIAEVGQIKLDGDIKLRCRAGIATGRVVVGGENQLDSAFGETLNLAARLQSEADENCLVIDRATQHMIGRAFRTAPIGSVNLKGFQHPIEIWQATEETKYLDRFDAQLEGAAGFAGRGDELRWLALSWQGLDQGRGRISIIRGDAGIGKSRLAREFERIVRQQGCPVLRFQCSPNHANSVFYPVIQQIEAGAGFDPHGEPSSGKLSKISDLFADAIAEDPRILQLLADLLSIPHDDAAALGALSAPQRRQLLIKVLVDNAVRLARRDPLLVILEDAHWIDPSSLELLQELSKRSADERIFILVTTRPGRELQLPGAPTELGLARLSDADVAIIARSINGGSDLSESELASIVQRVEGIPLFAEELTSTLLEQKSDTHRGLPENIQASIMARLDVLGDARYVAQIASVIGREFTHAQLGSLAGGAVSDLGKSLDRLVGSGLMHVRDPRNQSYAFKHALVQDVAYESLLRELKRQLHRRFVHEVLAHEEKERTPELAAHHLTEAGASVEALEYWKKAGYRASRASAHAEAIAHFTKGLALIAELNPDGRERLELAFQVGLIGPLIASKGYTSDELKSVISIALALSKKVDDAPEIFPVLYSRWSYLLTAGSVEEAFEVAQEFSKLAERQANKSALLARYRMLGASRMCLGALGEAEQDLDQAISQYVPEEHESLLTTYGVDIRVAAHCFLGEVHWLKGNSERARQNVESALAHAKNTGHVHSIAMSLFFCSLVSFLRQDRSAVRDYMEEMTALASRQAIGSWPIQGRSMLGWSHAAEGNIESGIALMNEGINASQKLGVSMFLPILKCRVAEILLSQQRSTEASLVIGEADAIIEQSGERNFEGEVHRLKGEVHRQSGSVDLAEREFLKAVDIARSQTAKAIGIRASTSYACLLAEESEIQQARDILTKAVDDFGPAIRDRDLESAQAVLEDLANRESRTKNRM